MVRAAIIGFGYMGRYHLEKARQLPELLTVVAAYDIDPLRGQAAEAQGLLACASLEQLLAMQEVQLVIICTPNQYHCPLAVAALEAGKHVLCEKPAVLNQQELEKVFAAAQQAERIFTVHHNRRWDKDFLIVQQLAENGSIGTMVTMESRVLGQRGVVFGWRADPTCGGGMLYDWGPHLVDQLLLLHPGKQVRRISARLLSVLTPAVDDFTEVTLQFEDGCAAHLLIATMALQPLPRWYVFGDRGSLSLQSFAADQGGLARIKGEVAGFESVISGKTLGPSRTMAPLESEHLETLVLPTVITDPLRFHSNVAKAVEGLEKPLITQIQIERVTRCLDAAFAAAQNGQTLEVCI